MKDAGINHFVYSILGRIGDFYIYFSSISKYVAAVCFTIAVATAMIKVLIGAAELREQIIKLLMTVVFYFLLLGAFPVVMNRALPMAMNMGYGAVFGGGMYESDSDGRFHYLNVSRSDYYRWLANCCGEIFSVDETVDSAGNNVHAALNCNIVDVRSGFIDLNKIFMLVGAFCKISFGAFPKVSLFSSYSGVVFFILLFYFMAIFLFIGCYIVAIINYVMALVDYFTLMGFGIIMVPLSLWEGTKSYTQAIIGGFGKIFIKLMVISAFMFLAVMTFTEAFENLFILERMVERGMIVKVADQAVELGQLALLLMFQGPIIAVLTAQTEKISAFLSGGNPQMSFMEGVAGLSQTAGAAIMGGVSGNVGAQFHSNMNVAKAKALAGGSAASSVGGSFIGGALDAGGAGVADAVRNLGKDSVGAAKALPNFMRSMGFNSFGRPSVSMPGGRGGSSPASGGGSSPAGGGEMAGSPASSGTDMAGASSQPGVASETAPYDTGTAGASSSGSQTAGGGSSASSGSNGGESPSSVAGASGGGDGSMGTYGSGDNAMLRYANMNSGAYSWWKRDTAMMAGVAGSVVNEVTKTSAERAGGNRVGNSTARAVMRGIGYGISGDIAGKSNIGGGARISFGQNSMVPQQLSGRSFSVHSYGAQAYINKTGDGLHKHDLKTTDSRVEEDLMKLNMEDKGE